MSRHHEQVGLGGVEVAPAISHQPAVHP
jgi:hypothetical protein